MAVPDRMAVLERMAVPENLHWDIAIDPSWCAADFGAFDAVYDAHKNDVTQSNPEHLDGAGGTANLQGANLQEGNLQEGNRQEQKWIQLARQVGAAAAQVAPELALPSLEISLLLTSDAQVQNLNRDWRDKDRPTNVLSFPMLTAEELQQLNDMAGLAEAAEPQERDESIAEAPSASPTPPAPPAPPTPPPPPSPPPPPNTFLQNSSAILRPPEMLGDIVLAFETCAAEAAAKHIALSHHAAHLILHGLLHLAGYDHETSAQDAEEMEAKEIKGLALMGLKDPYSLGAG